ncbi:DapH/DapD/GlmU-related protein [Vogesella sp. LIG4]|uniref:acyltransferase n=1 Tax=Vogesella sp. LIG4 TaxID=1192162 RepID=UPI001E5E6F2D|nr:acyltransferase [Vogesella sp. LIG4]
MLHACCLRVRGARLARGARIHAGSRFSRVRGIEMGEHARLYWGGDVLLGPRGEFRLGHSSHLAPHHYCLVADRRLSFGNHVAVGPRCMFFCHSNGIPADVTTTTFTECHIDGDITVGNNVLIGAGCIVLPGASIGDNVVVGAGSVVKGELESGWVYAGQPARKVKPLC